MQMRLEVTGDLSCRKGKSNYGSQVETQGKEEIWNVYFEVRQMVFVLVPMCRALVIFPSLQLFPVNLQRKWPFL